VESRILVAISANTEWRVIKELIGDVDIQYSPFGKWFETDQFGQPLIFFFEGWGKIAAAGATQYAIDRWQPDLLINLGTCGGFAGEIEKYAIILAEKTVVYDIIEQMGDYDEHIAHYTTDIDLSWLGNDYPQEVTRTLLVSGDRDLMIDEIPVLREKFGAVAGDWESGAIAWVAARNNLRCLILRGVTDLVGDQGGEAYDGDMNVFVEGTRVVMGKLLEALPVWVELYIKGNK
jgi:adenosylhomocysteine nucleosidase